MVLLREFEEHYGMKPLEVESFNNMENFKVIDSQFFNIIKRAFETKRDEPQDRIGTQRLYISMLKHLTSKEMITSTKIKTRGEDRDTYTYSRNYNFIKYHIELNAYSNNKYRNYDQTVIERYGLRAKPRSKPK